MANNYKFTGVALATTSETTLLTAAANSTVVIRSIRVTNNTSKTPTFNLERRIIQIKNSLSHLPNIEVISYSGLTVDCANDLKANLILRGLRAMSDFEYELQIAHTNKSLNNDIETIFLSTNTNYSFLSSSLVKEVAKFGGEINHMVPPSVERDLKEYFK